MATDTHDTGLRAAPPSLPPAKRFLFAALMVFLSLGVTLTGAELVARWHLERIRKSDALQPGLSQYDRLLGWRLAPGWQGRHRHYDFDVAYTINRYGFRGRGDDPAAAAHRIAVVGDSFTFGLGVNDEQTFTEVLNRDFANRIVFYNFGVPGYSTDQEYLLIKERVFLFAPHQIVLVVYLFNDLIDNLLPFPFQTSRAKPYFAAGAGGLELKNTPVPTTPKPPGQGPPESLHVVSGAYVAGRFDRMIAGLALARLSGLADRGGQGLSDAEMDRHLAEAKTLFALTLRQLDADCRSRGVCLTLALMPGSAYVTRPASASARMQDHIRRWILDTAGPKMPVIDLADRLRSAYNDKTQRLFFPNEGHLTPLGHEVVAEAFAVSGLDRLCQTH